MKFLYQGDWSKEGDFRSFNNVWWLWSRGFTSKGNILNLLFKKKLSSTFIVHWILM